MYTSQQVRAAGARRRGFSLAELMVVIVILGMLAAFIVPKVMDKFFKSQIGIAKAEVVVIANAVQDYRINNAGRAPASLEELIQPDENGTRYLDLDTTPTDPWGNPYVYVPDDGSGDFMVWCYGKDGVEGGEGDSRDFSHRMVKNKEIK